MLNEQMMCARLDGFFQTGLHQPTWPYTHQLGIHLYRIQYNTLRENCCPPIMEKRLSYKKPKPHHFYTLLVGMCNTVPWLLMCHYFQLLMQIDVSFQDIMLLSGELFMGTS